VIFTDTLNTLKQALGNVITTENVQSMIQEDSETKYTPLQTINLCPGEYYEPSKKKNFALRAKFIFVLIKRLFMMRLVLISDFVLIKRCPNEQTAMFAMFFLTGHFLNGYLE
jgi:hypothetical protein